MLAAILLFGVALVAAQDPKPCSSPGQFESRIYTTDYSKGFTKYARLTYDEYNRRVREVEELMIGKDREFFDVLYLHNVNREYRLNLRDRKCNSTTLTRPFIPAGVPSNAHYRGQVTIGPVNIANEHISVINFDGRTDEGNDIFGIVTSQDCVPVQTGFYSNRTGFIHTTYYDLTIGIPDPTVFDIPRECL